MPTPTAAGRPRWASRSPTSSPGCSGRSRSWPASWGAGGRARSTGPRGQRIDVSLLESTLAVLVNQAQNAFVTGRAPGRLGNAHPNLVPYETFATADGELAVAVGSERQWPRLCEALGLSGLSADQRFATNGDRVDNRADAPPDPRRPLRPAAHRRLAGRPRRRRDPVRPHQRHRRRLRVPAGAGPRDDRGRGASRAGCRAPGRAPVLVLRHAGIDPHRPAAPRRAHGGDPRGAGLRRRGHPRPWPTGA